MGCSNHKVISLSDVFGKIYAEILVDRASKVTEGFIKNEQGGFRTRRGFVD